MESRIDESKLKIFKPRLEKSMLGIGGKFYSSSSANVGICGNGKVYMIYVGLGIRPTTSSSIYGYIHIR